MNTKTFLHRTAAVLLIALMLFATLPAAPAGAVSLNITSIATGTWEATAWPNTTRSGMITVNAADVNVVGSGTLFTTELSVGNILRTTGDQMIGTVASITDDTHLTLVNPSVNARLDIAYHAQGVGPADNAIIDNGHTVTIAANAITQTGTVTVNAGGTLNISKLGTEFQNTLTVNGVVSADESAAFGELIVNNGGIFDAAGTATTVLYTASSLTINSGGIANISRDLTVDGTTSISGTINFSSNSINSRAMIFLGAVTLNGGSTWNEPALGNGANNTYTFSDNFTNNAAVFIASPTSQHSFGGNSKTINGSTNTAIAKVKVDGTYTNNGILTVGDLLSGLGTLTNSAAGTLNIEKEVTVNSLDNAGTMNKTGTGAISTPFTNTGTLNLNGTGTIASITNNAGGTVNLAESGSIGTFVNATATSVLKISDLLPPNITTFTISAPGNTVNYNGLGDQTVKSTTYSNLILSGSGNKSISMTTGSTLATGNVSIAPSGTAKANITGQNLAVNGLALGGSGKINGTWGSTASAAGNKDDTFFTLTNGYLNVATDTRSTQTINFTSSAPSNAGVGGPTYTPTATATSGLAVTFTIDASASAICSISAGAVSFHEPGTCVINANQAGNANFKPAAQVQQSFTVSFTGTHVHVTIGGTEVPASPFTIIAGASTRRSFAAIDKGPVKVEGLAPAAPIFAAERVIHKFNGVNTSFSEMMGLPDNQVDTTYWLPWYNSRSLNTQLRIANLGSSQATIHVRIGGTDVPGSPFNLAAGASTRKFFPDIDKGPVEIESTQPIIAAERVLYSVNGAQTSFTEMMALPASQLDTIYWLPWYNSKSLDTQLRIANVSNSAATVNVSINGNPVDGSPFTIPVGGSKRLSFPNLDEGPVKIESNVNVVAAERVIYKLNGVPTSFSEMMALPDSQKDTIFWMPWYNSKSLDTQLRIANVSGSTATVDISIGGTPVIGSPFTIPAGGSIRRNFPNIDKGPVKIESNVDIIAAERVIYKVNNVVASFSEMMGLPNGLLDTLYWFPWYNSKDLDTQLRFGMP